MQKDEGYPTEKILLTKIKPNPMQPRKQFTEDSLKLLAKTIKERGDVVDPIKVTPRGKGKDLFYLIIDGERRYRSSAMAQVKKISARIYPRMSDKEVMILSCLSNFCREEMTVIEKARAISFMMKENNWNQVEVGQAIGLSQGTISNILKILNLTEDIQQLVLDGQLDTGTALLLSPHSAERQAVLLEECRKIVKENGGKRLPIQKMARAIKQAAEVMGFGKKQSKRALTSNEITARTTYRLMEKLFSEVKLLLAMPKEEREELKDPSLRQIIVLAENLGDKLVQVEHLA